MWCCGRILIALAIAFASSTVVRAQGSDAASPPPSEQALKPEQLEALVAPIALYPDTLLANVLAASTYPLEVVQADRWLGERKSLKGDKLKAEVDKQQWDDSVKALVGTPDVLAMMSKKIDWTKDLGDAVLAQQPDVMDAVQRLRERAQANQKLATTKQQKVSVQQAEGKQVIVIEPTDPNTLYVPYYDPATVYGTWPYAEYPPYYFGVPSYIGAGIIATGIAFGAGFALARWGNYWGGGCNWANRSFVVNRSVRTNWQHNPAHRQGVRYNNAAVRQRFGNTAQRAGAANRMDFRGRSGQEVLRPGQDRAGAGDRAANRAADRGRAADKGKAGNRASAANRAGAGNRARAATGGAGRGGRDGALRNVSSGRAANLQAARGRQSFASAGVSRASFAGAGGVRGGGMGGFRGGGGGGFRGGGGGGFRGGGGGRRSDIALKHDVILLGHLQNGLGYYRFSYLGSNKAYVGVIAQEVRDVMPEAVTRGSDGYLRVRYDKLGIAFSSYEQWLAAGGLVPQQAGVQP